MEDSATSAGGVRIVSRRVVRPESPDGGAPSSEPEVMHLTPWDLRMIAVDYIQKGLLLPKPPTGGGAQLLDGLASSLARAPRALLPAGRPPRRRGGHNYKSGGSAGHRSLPRLQR
ncbi:hypothetical protein BS78_K326300 [Paspalum vaginatum]|uniref:Uncharacterized protein n=1 Tax=Paspalum vaginatum TaxID=158149 RepID=A0A9W7X9Y5_9POAL|nr:hypothetical protein BS78_K326300 [Paspalum vaginatum]